LAFNKKFKFGVFLPKYEDLEYWETQIKGIFKAADEFEKYGVSLEYHFYDFNQNAFQSLAKSILELDFDGLLFSPIFYEESVLFLEEFKKKNIPLVMIDSNIEENDSHYYIGQNAFRSGYLAGRLISFAVKNERKVLIIKITREIESTSVYLQRIDGFYTFFKENQGLTNFTFKEVTIRDSNFDKLDKTMFDDINSIFIPNSRAHFIAQFLEQNKITGIRIVGYDLLKDNVAFLNKGMIDFLINQKPEQQGYMGIQLLYKKLVIQESVTHTQYIPLEIILKENYLEAHF
jgi:LacI family transcriptional regulator